MLEVLNSCLEVSAQRATMVLCLFGGNIRDSNKDQGIHSFIPPEIVTKYTT